MAKVKNIVTIGDGAVGKTCLLHAFTEEAFLNDYIPTIFEKSEFEINVDDVPHMIKLYDTAGQEEYEALRKSIYKHANCFIVCYSINNRDSFENVRPFWIKELSAAAGHVPIILCATKLDLKDSSSNCVTTEEGMALSRQINAFSFIECSAKENLRVKETIYEAVRASTGAVNPQSNDINTNNKSDCECCVIS
ncbi:ras-like GTP-binding protein RhoL [Culicoides brevitarsis]|uniref:ras-like GTP-binding protein RhoL n=1 Tax=Culicoides brevitarsis TaxID=469753 RepID=UPI00307C5AFA